MVRADFNGELADAPMWSFDGSSTEQADGSNSDCLLKPVHIIPDPVRLNGFLVISGSVLNRNIFSGIRKRIYHQASRQAATHLLRDHTIVRLVLKMLTAGI
jgi:hypothetical protein